MEPLLQLRLVAQISISLAGFSGIVASFQYRNENKVTRGDTLGLVMLVNISLVAILFSVLPIVLFNFAVNERTVWGVCSGMLSINYLIFLYYIKSRLKHVRVWRTSTKITHWLYYALGLVTIILNILNAADIWFHREFPLYFVSLLLPLTAAGYMFARLVSRPLWRAIRKQENKITSEI